MHAPHQVEEAYELATPTPAALRAASGGSAGISFHVAMLYEIGVNQGEDRSGPSRHAGAWKAVIRAYSFRVLDGVGTESLVWHWQPGPVFLGPDHPHLHVSAAIQRRSPAGEVVGIDLDRRHLPTGPVTLAAVVRMLIEEFDVAGRGDWDRTLRRADIALAAALRDID